jgi:hypothetical protein
MRSRWLFYVIAAIVLGAVSPAVASLTSVVDLNNPSLFDWWFLMLPLTFDMHVSPGAEYRVPLWIAIYTLQYLTLFAAMAASVPPARFLRDFIGRPRHRGGLVRR